MKTTTAILAFLCALLTSSLSFASSGLIIYTAEFGVGKFHRYDSKVRSYHPDNAWFNYILADNAATDHALSKKNADGSYTIFYSTLEEMLQAVIQISNTENQKIAVLNVHGHGLPGGMWFPADQATLNSDQCGSWVQAATGADKDNYDQYYSAVTKSEVMQIRSLSNLTNPGLMMGCVTGLNEWKTVVGRNPQIKTVLSSDAQIHFASCVVGLGKAGEAFTKGIAALLLPTGGHVVTSTNFGLGDWSMPEGMGFWDYISDSQIEQDAQNYPVNRTDRDVMQKGVVRVAKFSGSWNTSLVGNQDFMNLQVDQQIIGPEIAEPVMKMEPVDISRVRIPGTNAYVEVR
ncbi:MAG: hypothetical protein ACXVAX_05230 [Pseudobdellovibrio sp.]